MSVSIKDLCFSIDKNTILDRVSLEFEHGFVGVIGPNGAGKTTLLRMISGYLKPDSGSVELFGSDVRGVDFKQRAKMMALVPQNYAFDYDFTVLQTVLMGRNPHKKMFESDNADDIRIARDSIKKAGIEHLAERSVIGLSGGEWQRMIIARALCQESRILLLDEPVSSLDIKHQVGIMDMVHALVREKDMLAICVLHDLNLTYNYCDRVALLSEGRVHSCGTPKDVLTQDTILSVYGAKVNVVEYENNRYVLPVMLDKR